MYLNRTPVVTLKSESLDCTDPNTCPNPFTFIRPYGVLVSAAAGLGRGEGSIYVFNSPPFGFGNPATRGVATIFGDNYPRVGFDFWFAAVPGSAATSESYLIVSYRYQGETAAAGLAGQWSTNFGPFTGPVTMSVNGNSVIGTYKNTDGTFNGTFTCTVSGNTCTGTFADPANSGAIVLTLAADGGSFTAAWSATNGNKGTWSGTKASSSICTGTCTLSPLGQAIGAGGGSGTVGVTTSSTWTAVPDAPWIHVASGATGSGNGTVTFTVDPNTGAPRSGTISIAGQTASVFQNGTPVGITAGCNYLIQSNTTQNVAVASANGLIQIVTNQSCGWTASTSTPWITLNSGASSVGNGAVSYTAAANTTGSPRSGSIVIAGQNVVVNQAGGVLPGTPAIATGGIVNAASYAPGGAPNSLAEGSFFSIFGTSLGPDQPLKVSGYPLPATLSGVGVKFVQGSNSYDAPLVFVSATQINGIIPSNVALGSAQVTVSYNGKTSSLANILVSKTSLGVFFQAVNGNNTGIAQNVASSTDYPLNLPSTPAKPGQIVIMWATGLGPLNGPDNVAPGVNAGDMTGVPVTITVGGVPVPRLYAGRQSETAGVDNVYFTLPIGVPLGCNVPVAITAGGGAANTTTIAISADGSPCQ